MTLSTEIDNLNRSSRHDVISRGFKDSDLELGRWFFWEDFLMKRILLGLVAVASVAVSSIGAFAGVWLDNNGAGSVAGSFDAFTPSSGSLAGPLTVEDFLYNTGSSSRTGAFQGISENNSLVWGGTYNFEQHGETVGDPYSFSSATFGNFVGSVQSETVNNLADDLLAPGSRQLNFVGTFTPGSNSHYESDTTSYTNVTLQISFSRSASVDPGNSIPGAINVSWALNTSGGSPSVVPEPTSIAIFSLGAMGFAARRFRRK